MPVEAVNNPPVITSTPLTIAPESEPYTYDVGATDADNDELSFSLTESPTGMTIDASTGVISWTPLFTQVGSHNVAVSVQDGRGGSDSQSFTLAVTDVSPEVIFTEDTTIEESDMQYDGMDIGVDGATLTIHGSHSFADMVVQNATVIAETFQVDTLLLSNGSILTHPGATTTTESRLELTVETLTIDSTSKIDVTGKGYGSSSGLGGGIFDDREGSGAGYGGNGGDGSDKIGGFAYGSVTTPVDLGSGGGSAQWGGWGTATGGAGGGAVKINAGVLTVDGSIIANGVNGGVSEPKGEGQYSKKQKRNLMVI